MSPDKVSSLFPDRPIRPLPKRKLREKLLLEDIRTIKYLLPAVDSAPLFYYPTCRTREGHDFTEDTARAGREPHKTEVGYSTCTTVANLNGHDSTMQGPAVEKQPRDLQNESTRPVARLDGRGKARQTSSETSSIDGFDSLENTNNKKKRKIPSVPDTVLRGSHFVASELVGELKPGSGIDRKSQGIISASYSAPQSLPIYNESISGPGRGRFGRSGHARSPLRTFSGGNNAWPGRPLKAGQHHTGTGTAYETGGIISNAIANAERLLSPVQESTSSLLHQQSASGKSTPMAAQFTFTCVSQIPGTVSWSNTLPNNSILANYTTTVPMNHSNGIPPDTSAPSEANRGEQKKTRANNRRQLERGLFSAARHRRQVAANDYCHNPPRLEDIWICEFCEYERIFGNPPKALIREYEIKDRRLRQEEADRRRLLQKAKAKSRKGRKSSKGIKGIQSTGHSSRQGLEDHPAAEAPLIEPDQNQSTQSEGQFEEGLDHYRARDPPDILGLYGQTIQARENPHIEI